MTKKKESWTNSNGKKKPLTGIWLSKAEMDLVEEAAAGLGITVSEYIKSHRHLPIDRGTANSQVRLYYLE